MTKMNKKTVLITGGAAGIGRAAALLFAKKNYCVVIADINEQQGNKALEHIKKITKDCAFIKADISDNLSVKNMFIEINKHYGRLDCAFNNAGIEGKMEPLDQSDIKNWNKVIGINLTGMYMCMKTEISQMLEQGYGAIVNTSSVAGLVGFPNVSAYAASKHAVIGLTKTAALEYAQKNIRINAVCPGVIETEMIQRITGDDPETKKRFASFAPMNRMGKPEEIASAVVWLCSDESMFVTGESMTIDGGYTAR